MKVARGERVEESCRVPARQETEGDIGGGDTEVVLWEVPEGHTHSRQAEIAR